MKHEKFPLQIVSWQRRSRRTIAHNQQLANNKAKHQSRAHLVTQLSAGARVLIRTPQQRVAKQPENTDCACQRVRAKITAPRLHQHRRLHSRRRNLWRLLGWIRRNVRAPTSVSHTEFCTRECPQLTLLSPLSCQLRLSRPLHLHPLQDGVVRSCWF